ncbi:hypothetical protein [Clostridium sp. AWRP]|nr:hypothetical protein [Clostridium sp. AWRP]
MLLYYNILLYFGILLIVIGMILNSCIVDKKEEKEEVYEDIV